MKLIFCLLFFVLVEIHNARQSNSPKVISIPLTTTRKRTTSANARSIIIDEKDSTTGPLLISGRPFQDFKVSFDTGSLDLWVFSSKYDTCDPYWEIVSKNQKMYDSEISSTFQKVTSRYKNPRAKLIEYGIGWVFGFWLIDVIMLDGIRIKRRFLEVTKTSRNRAERGNINGILGLRYQPKKSSIVSNFCDKFQAEHKFSYYLPKLDTKGELLLCGENKTKYVENTMKYIDETDPGTWFLPLDSVEMEETSGDYPLSSKNKVLIDTGATHIFGPAEDLGAFSISLQSFFIGNLPNQKVDCRYIHLFPKLAFTMNGTKFTLTGYEYTIAVKNECWVLISAREEVPWWTLGEPFLRKYYTVFDMKNHRIGFAESKG